jgi:S1-C subfamily serine protease
VGFYLSGRVSVRSCALAILVLVAVGHAAWAGDCVDPRQYANSVVRIERVVEQGAPRSWVGSGWFYQSRHVLITNEHVVAKLALREQAWTSVLLQASKPDASYGYIQRTRAQVLVRDARDDLALVLLEHPVMGVRPMDINTGEVSPGEPLAIAGYASGLLHFGIAHAYAGPQPVARFRQPESQFAIDVQGDANQAAFSAGGSGSPILNCEGQVVGIFSNLIDERYLSLFGMSGTRGRPTSAASPNAFAVRINALQTLYASLNH